MTDQEILDAARESNAPHIRLLAMIYCMLLDVEHAIVHQQDQSPESYDWDHPHAA